MPGSPAGLRVRFGPRGPRTSGELRLAGRRVPKPTEVEVAPFPLTLFGYAAAAVAGASRIMPRIRSGCGSRARGVAPARVVRSLDVAEEPRAGLIAALLSLEGPL